MALYNTVCTEGCLNPFPLGEMEKPSFKPPLRHVRIVFPLSRFSCMYVCRNNVYGVGRVCPPHSQSSKPFSPSREVYLMIVLLFKSSEILLLLRVSREKKKEGHVISIRI